MEVTKRWWIWGKKAKKTEKNGSSEAAINTTIPTTIRVQCTTTITTHGAMWALSVGMYLYAANIIVISVNIIIDTITFIITGSSTTQ